MQKREVTVQRKRTVPASATPIIASGERGRVMVEPGCVLVRCVCMCERTILYTKLYNF